MARTLYLPDGSCEVVIGDSARCLQRLIYERLGRDCEELFVELFADYEEQIKELKEDAKSYEQNADGYMAMCHEAVEGIDSSLELFEEPRLDKKKLKERLQITRDSLWKNL